MTDHMHQPARRATLATLGLGTLGALLSHAAQATDASASAKDNAARETTNTKLVTDFCAAWAGRDVEKLIPFISAEIEYHMFEGAPPIKGVDQFRQRLGGFMSGMKEIRWDTSRSYAIGDLVFNERVDHFIQKPDAGKPDNHFHVAGVFLVREGKIVYWKDYNMPK
jgi:limonene-1,2-epoxide hydrolase